MMFSNKRKSGVLGSGCVCVNVRWLLKVMSMGLLVFLPLVNKGYAQDKPDAGESFIFTNILGISEIKDKAEGMPVDDIKNLEDKKVRIIKVSEDSVSEDSVYFKFWNFKENSDASYLSYNDKEYSTLLNEFKQYTRKVYPTYKGATVGAYTLPFRLRGVFNPNNFDFESSLSLQANIVFGLGSKYKQESWIDLSAGLGITGVYLTKSNTSGEHQVEENRTASAFTVSFGALFKPAKMVNIGAFLGWDMLGENDRKTNWRYDGRAWLGLGINIFFNELITDKNPTRDKQKAKTPKNSKNSSS